MESITCSRPRVTGKILSDFKGQLVTLLGNVTQLESGGSGGFYLTTTDEQNILIKCSDSATFEVTPGIAIEVSGRVDQSGRIVLAESFVPINSPIDFNLYNLAVSKIHQLGASIYPHIDASQINAD